jgi:putative inorganic carbon (HCO3(-)) transporter
MTFPHENFEQYFPSGRKLVLLLIIVLSTSGAMGAIAAQEPMLMIGLVLAVLLIVTTTVWPDVPTLAVIFILYTNAAVVAVQFHGVPFIIGASVPLLLIIPLANYAIFHRQKLIFHPLLLLLVLFLVVQMLGALLAVKLDAAISQLITYLTEGLGLYFLITNVVRTSEMLRRAIWILLLAGALLGGLSFYQQVTQTFDNDYGGFAQVSAAAFGTGEEKLLGKVEQLRLAGPIGEQNRYAQTMLMLVPLGLFRIWGERSLWRRILAGIATILIALGVLLTFSRGAAIAFGLMLVMMVAMGYIKPQQIFIVLLGLILLWQTVPQVAARLTSLEALSGLATGDNSTAIAEADGSTKSRLTEMAAAGLVFADHPLVGVGPGMFKYYYRDYAEVVGLRVLNANRQAHSLFPGLAAEHGLLGLLCFLGILFVTMRNLARTRKRWLRRRPELANVATGFMLAIFAYLTTGLFLHFGYARFFWLIMALAGVVSYVADSEVSATAEPDEREAQNAIPALVKPNLTLFTPS